MLSTDNKKLFFFFFFFYKTLAFSDDPSFGRSKKQAIGMLRVDSIANNIAHHFGCSRQIIYKIVNMYNITGSVRDGARPGHAHMTLLRTYRVITLTRLSNRVLPAPIIDLCLQGSCTDDH